ncbi:hypothetical protein [Oleidesulfovibrio sp.]|uniref:hypothetical protein n=1 Tax=Oleidesulfovibrio sp. TaxID=2909707 RepID=UPI003A88A580
MAISFDRFPLGMDAIRRDLQMDGAEFGPRKTAAGTLHTGTAAEAQQAVNQASGGGIVVEISDEARRKADEEFGQSFTSTSGKVEKEDEDKTSVEQAIDRIKERIEKLKQEIREIEQKIMPEELKQNMLEAKRSELMQLQQQLSELLGKLGESAGAGRDGRGTSAQGAGELVRPE